jgi:menaquinone-9 beta-reductase
MGGVPIRRLRLASGARMAEAPLPFMAYGLSRLRLDSALRARATEKGAALRLGAPVRRLDDARAVLADGQALAAKRIVLATGKHDLSDRRRVPLDSAGMVGFKLHLRLAPQQADALADCIELHFFQGGYAGLQRIEGGLVNLSFVIDDAAFARAGRSFPGALAAVAPVGSLLAERLAGHQPEWERPLAVSRIPYGYRIWRTPAGPDWLWPIGDQAAVIPSFTGDGMAMALVSGAEAARLILGGAGPEDLRDALRARSVHQFGAAGVISLAVGSSAGRAITVPIVRSVPRLATILAAMTRVSGHRAQNAAP